LISIHALSSLSHGSLVRCFMVLSVIFPHEAHFFHATYWFFPLGPRGLPQLLGLIPEPLGRDMVDVANETWVINTLVNPVPHEVLPGDGPAVGAWSHWGDLPRAPIS